MRDEETIKKRKIDKNWANWLHGYLIVTSVLLQMHPIKVTALLLKLIGP